jgi:hypothetical protein
MSRSFVRPNPGSATLAKLPKSTDDDIRNLARLAGLDLPPELMGQLCESYPAFEAMVRRLPRHRPRFDEPAHHHVPFARIDDE